MVGRSSDTSAISTRPTRSGKKRSRAVSRSAVSAGLLASPRATSAKLTLPEGNSETVGRAAQDRVEPGDRADLAQRLLAHGVGRNQEAVGREQRAGPTATTASSAKPRRLKPAAAVKGEYPVDTASGAGGLYHRSCYANLGRPL